MADITGGQFFRSVVAGDIVDVLNEFNLVRVASVTIENVTTGEVTAGTVNADGSFYGDVGLQSGSNTLRVTVTTEGGGTATGDCESTVDLVYENLLCNPLNALTWGATCRVGRQPEARLRTVAVDDRSSGVFLVFLPAALADGHRLYRGDLDVLHGGAYNHASPFSTDPLQPECNLPAGVTSFLDLGVARDGRNHYYLVVALASGVEGTHGWADRDADGLADTERPGPDDDPSDLVIGLCP
jgi:hypothetical protein